MTTNEFKCQGCDHIMPVEEMSPDSQGWCVECDEAEVEYAREQEDDCRDGWDDQDFEDPRVTYERERGEAFQDRVDMWRNEY